MLETLNPPERLAFVLHDMFDEIATILDRSPEAASQLAIRAGRIVEFDILADPVRIADLDLSVLGP